MRILLSIMLCCLLTSCGEEVIQRPEALIPPGKMVDILYDIALINAAKSTNPSILDNHDIKVMEFVYKKHGIDSALFAASDIYYAAKPAEYEAIYQIVEARFEQEREALEEEQRRVSDSLRIEAEKKRAKSTGLESTD